MMSKTIYSWNLQAWVSTSSTTKTSNRKTKDVIVLIHLKILRRLNSIQKTSMMHKMESLRLLAIWIHSRIHSPTPRPSQWLKNWNQWKYRTIIWTRLKIVRPIKMMKVLLRRSWRRMLRRGPMRSWASLLSFQPRRKKK
jgi:hypothetical protein